MEINKQLFEDVLSGKLKGTFVLRNGDKVKSSRLSIDTNADTNYPISLNGYWYTNQGEFNLTRKCNIDIIDFIPDTDMETKELEIQIPEGYEIDKENSTFEKIVFKKKDTKPRSWEEYCKNFKGQYYYIQDNRDNIATSFTPNGYGLVSAYKNYIPTKELAEAFLAMMQLMSLRQAWIGDWKPDYYMNMASNWCIEYEPNPGVFSIANHCKTNGGGLTFPTREMTKDFMNCFKDLLEIAKPLI